MFINDVLSRDERVNEKNELNTRSMSPLLLKL
jgi:hypothetical protein